MKKKKTAKNTDIHAVKADEHDHHHDEYENHHDHHHDEHEHHCDHHHDEHEHHCGCEHEHEHGDHCSCDHDHHHEEIEARAHKSTENAAKVAVFRLDEIDCPHCASQIESELEKVNGIMTAEINLISGQLTIGADSSYRGDLYKEAVRAVKLYEPDVEVIDEANKADKTKKPSLIKALRSEKATVIRFTVGAILYAIGFGLALTHSFPLVTYLPILIVSYIILGFDVVFDAVRNIFRGRIFDEKFLMTVSTIGAFAIGEYPEAVAVMLFYQIGEFFQSLAVKRSRRSVSELMDIRPDSANVVRGKETLTVSPEDVKLGETIVVRPGEKIPLDGEIVSGESRLDMRALTGESVPKSVRCGDSVLSGCINESGVIEIKVTKRFSESTASKILDLVENAAGRKAPTENFISVFARYYTPIVVLLALLLAVVPPLFFHGAWAQWVRRCFVFLVISCPCALVISIPLTFFSGIGAASRKGVLVKGSNYLEALNFVDTVVFDKTGTLTKGVFKVTEILPANGEDKDELLKTAALAESMSNHPIARSIISAYGKGTKKPDSYEEIAGRGACAKSGGKVIYAGSSKLMLDQGISFTERSFGGTVVYVASDKKYLGCIVISDEIKEGSAEAVGGLSKLGVSRAVMLTGDNERAAKAAAEKLGLTEYHGGLLPADKVELVEKLLESENGGGKLAFVGDGINDAPVLARADVGIAMGALGSDAAIEAADIVLMNDDPRAICDAIEVAKHTKKIVTQNIVMVLLVKIVILALGAFGIAGMWEAVFGDVGIMIIAVLNSMRRPHRRLSGNDQAEEV